MHAPESSQPEDSAVSSWALCAEIARLVRIERKAAWLLCHHFATLADRFDAKDPELDSYEDVCQLGRLRFGMTDRQVRERVRVGRSLRVLPRTRAAFAQGAMSYAKVREVSRIAEPETEEQWLATARAESVRSLERTVARARRPDTQPASDPLEVKRAEDGAFVDVHLRLPMATWQLVQRAMEATRVRSQVAMADAAALEAVARHALAATSVGAGPTAPGAASSEADDEEFLEGVAARTEIESPSAADASDATSAEPDPTYEPSATQDRSTTRPGHSDNEAGAAEQSAEMAGLGTDEAIAPAPGRCPLSDYCVDAARQIVPLIERGEGGNEEEISCRTGLSAQRVSVAVVELMLAGIVTRTHTGLALTRWGLRHRFKAVKSKLRH